MEQYLDIFGNFAFPVGFAIYFLTVLTKSLETIKQNTRTIALRQAIILRELGVETKHIDRVIEEFSNE